MMFISATTILNVCVASSTKLHLVTLQKHQYQLCNVILYVLHTCVIYTNISCVCNIICIAHMCNIYISMQLKVFDICSWSLL